MCEQYFPERAKDITVRLLRNFNFGFFDNIRERERERHRDFEETKLDSLALPGTSSLTRQTKT